METEKTDKMMRHISMKTAGRTPVYPAEQMRGTSAVLVPLIRQDRELYLLYEKRASTLDHQPGEICFPGGRMEPGETASQTAVREACEELLISESQIHILGKMDGVMGPSGAPVWPVIAELTDYDGTFSTDEVSMTFTVSVTWLREHPAESYDTVLQTVPQEGFPYDLIPGGKDYTFARKHRRMYFYRYPGDTIWGLTANITDNFMHLVTDF